MKKSLIFILAFSVSFLHSFCLYAQTNLTKHPSEVLSFGSSGEWDNFSVGSPSVIFNGSIYHMWYTGADGTVNGNSIGYATSNDGITWAKYSNEPVLSGVSGEWDHSINNASVVLANGQYMMYYSGSANRSPERIGLATSSNGMNWTKHPDNPIKTNGPSGSWNALLVRRPSVIYDGNLFEIWFAGNDGGPMGAHDRLGYATSADGIIWTDDVTNPVLEGDTSFQKNASVGKPSVIRDASQYLMYYGTQDKVSQLGYMWIAFSSDGIMWEQSTMPVLTPDDPAEWDYNYLGNGSGSAILQNGIYKLWYTASTGGPGAQIGYAEGPAPNQPPDCSLAAIPDQSANAGCGATISGADVTGVTDPDGDPLTITVSPSTLMFGANTVNITADDGKGGICSNDITVNVVDDTPPVLTASTSPITLWPPNHKYSTIDISQCVAVVSDNCNTSLSISEVTITKVTSDEEENAKGGGDGNTLNDIVIDFGCQSVQLRAERQGSGNGRVYTIHLLVDDGNGNSSTATCLVTVPNSQNGSPAVDDGPSGYEESCGSALAKLSGSEQDDLMENAFIPDGYALFQNHPNPFNPSTVISFAVPTASEVTLSIHNLRGQLIDILHSGVISAGRHSMVWNGKDSRGAKVASGVYLYQLRGKNFVATKKLVLTK